jgi:phosphatidylglycerol lysyltransferase
MRTIHPKTRARVLAIVVALMGLLNVISSAFFGVTRRLQWLRQVLPPAITLGSRGLSLISGFLLMAVAWNLAQRKQVAWILTTWLLAISALSHILKGLDAEEAAIALVLLALLWWFRRDFTVRSDPNAILGALFAVPYAVIFFFLYGVAGFYVLRHQFQPSFDLNGAIGDVIRLATFQGEQIYTPLTREARWFAESVTLMTGVSVAYLAYSLTRPVLRPTPVTRRDREVAADIIQNYGSSGIAFFALGRDKSYFFNDDADCVIAYRLVRGVALAAGDPFGPADAIGPTLNAFRAFCEDNHWAPAFYQVPEQTLLLHRQAGLEVLKVGEEALVDIPSFDLKGKAKDDLRSASNRAKREGWQFSFFDHPIENEGIVMQLESLSEAWLRDKFGGEMGFTMGGSPVTGGNRTLVTTVADAAGRIMAFMTWVPMFGVAGWAGDLMRRAADAPNGVMEYLIVATIEQLRQHGDKLISLGLAPLADVEPENPQAILSLEKGIELIYERFNTVYHYKSLHAFKLKFVPRWESRFLTYPGLPTLPRVVYALVNAQMPQFTLGEIGKLVRHAE